jgi:hypothetical protein
MKCGDGKTACQIRRCNEKREIELRKHADLEIVWECEINSRLKTEPEMKKFFDETFDNGALKLRDAFFGGRTNVEKMIGTADAEHVVKYVDVQVCNF